LVIYNPYKETFKRYETIWNALKDKCTSMHSKIVKRNILTLQAAMIGVKIKIIWVMNVFTKQRLEQREGC
jgi:hypothetical protein